MSDIKRRKSKREDPDVYIKKAFGKNFEFSEKYLTSNINSEKIIKALKKRYGFSKITKATLKHVLYEGARVNRILLINDSWFDKMVEILNIPLDSDEENKNISDEDDKNQIHLPVHANFKYKRKIVILLFINFLQLIFTYLRKYTSCQFSFILFFIYFSLK